MPRSGEQTRQQLIAAAEQLFAARGVAGVSLREINAAAGQRNNSALHYHFNDRDGLLAAMAEKHMPAIQARQQLLYERFAAAGRVGEPAAFVELSILPFADHLAAGPSERAWIIVASELAGHARTDTELLSASASPAAVAMGLPVFEALAERAGPELALHRLRSVAEAALHLLADRARHEEAADRTRDLLPLATFVDDLVAMMTAALGAPFSGRVGASGDLASTVPGSSADPSAPSGRATP